LQIIANKKNSNTALYVYHTGPWFSYGKKNQLLIKAKEMLRTELNNYWQHGQLYEFNLVRCDVIVHYVMNKIINTF